MGKQRFDLVILRQPNIFYLRETFTSIINSIQTLINPDGLVFLSVYHLEELREVANLMADRYECVPKSDCKQLSNGHGFIIDGDELEPDKYSTLFRPQPELKARIEKEIEDEELEINRYVKS